MPGDISTAADFAARFDVSRETRDRLMLYAERLEKWNKAINLVAKSTLPKLWQRHMADSAQAFAHIPDGARTLLDLGSGGGFPGLVLAILGAGRLDVHLVDSDQRKGVFLRDVSRETGVPVTVHTARIEALKGAEAVPAFFDVVSARACAPLDQLCGFAHPFWKKDTVGLFLKGRGAHEELTRAQDRWTLRADLIPSVSDGDAHLVRLQDLSPRDGNGEAVQ